jgi:hypothetical protein
MARSFFYIGKPDEWYGQAIAQHANTASESIQKVRAVSLDGILSPLDSVDLVDLDVQGAEFIVLRSAIAALNDKVKRVHIGAHGHDIETELRTLFRQNDWYKLNDYGCLSTQANPMGRHRVSGWCANLDQSTGPIHFDALNHLQGVLATSEQHEGQLTKMQPGCVAARTWSAASKPGTGATGQSSAEGKHGTY